MIYLLLAILSSSLVSIFMRLSEKWVRNNMAMFMSNYTICVLLSLAMGHHKLSGGSLSSASFAMILGLVTGIFYLVSFVLYRINIEKNGIVLSALFMKLGVLVPTLTAITIYHETLKITVGIGFLIAIGAIILINTDFEEDDHKSQAILLLIALLLTGGMGDTCANIYDKGGIPAFKDLFLLFTFLTALILCVCLKIQKKQGITFPDLVWGALIGIPNYFSARFLLLSLSSLPAVMVYPVYNVAVILVVTIVEIMVFREQINQRKGIALLFMLAALILLNL